MPALRQLARTSHDQLARIHALWTLEGLGAADAALVRELMKDADPQIRIQAIRASETLYKAGDRSLRRRLQGAGQGRRHRRRHAGADDAQHAEGGRSAERRSRRPSTATRRKGVQLVANADPQPGGERGARRPRVDRRHRASRPTSRRRSTRAARSTAGVLRLSRRRRPRRADAGRASGHHAAPAAGRRRHACSGHQDYVIKTLLHGLTGPVNGATYPEVMVPMGQSPDDWIAAIASYIRNSFGNRASLVSAGEVARVRAATASRKNIVDDQRIGGVAAEARACRRLETVGQSQPGHRRARARHPARGRPARRSNPACGFRSSCRSRRC